MGESCSIQYGAQLEKVTFQFSTADFVYMLLFGMATLLVRPCLLTMIATERCIVFLLLLNCIEIDSTM